MLSASSEMAYLHEPLNPDSFRRGRCTAQFKHFFPYICEKNGAKYFDSLKALLEFRYQWRQELPYIKAPRDVGRTLRDSVKYAWYALKGARPLVKDPIAVMSAEWLAKTFNMDVLVMIRHPAAFAASLKKKGQVFRFSELLNQPLLMDARLSVFREEMERYRHGAETRVDEAILLWRIIYSVVSEYCVRHPDWIFVRHEDLSRDPLSGFEELYEKLGLTYSAAVRTTIKKHIEANGRKHVVGGNNISIDSEANIRSWANILSPDEIERVKAGTLDVYGHFYEEKER